MGKLPEPRAPTLTQSKKLIWNKLKLFQKVNFENVQHDFCSYVMVTARHFKTALYRFTAFHLDWAAFYTYWVTLTPKQGLLSYSSWEYSLTITSTQKVSGYTIKPAACITITRRLAYQHASKKGYGDKKYFSDAAAQIIPQQNMEELGNASNINQTTSSSLVQNHQPSTFLLPVRHKAGERSSTSRILWLTPHSLQTRLWKTGRGPSNRSIHARGPANHTIRMMSGFNLNWVPQHQCLFLILSQSTYMCTEWWLHSSTEGVYGGRICNENTTAAETHVTALLSVAVLRLCGIMWSMPLHQSCHSTANRMSPRWPTNAY